MRLMDFIVAGALALTARPSVGAGDAATRRIIGECSTEVGLLCAGRSAVKPCLEEQLDSLTPACRGAVRDSDVPRPSRPMARVEASPKSLPASETPMMPHGASISIGDHYDGKGNQGFPALHALLKKEVPDGVRIVGERLGLPQYADGLTQPLFVHFYYDPTSRDGVAHVGPGGDETTPAQIMEFNLAWWEDCPSVEQFRSLLHHELTHVVVQDYLYGRPYYNLPAWLNEGLAMWAGGESAATAWLDADYVQYTRKRREIGSCSLDNDLEHGNALRDCYARYYLAVREIEASAPGAVTKLLADLRHDVPPAEAIRARTGADWSGFQDRVRSRAQRTYDEMWAWNKARHKLRMWFQCAGTAS